MRLGLVLSLGLRNLRRNLRRTAITSVSVVAGVAVLIMGWGFVDGLDENVIRAEEQSRSGHVLLRPPGWPEEKRQIPLDKAAEPPPALRAALQDQRWTGRLFFAGRLIQGMEAMRVVVIGYDPAGEEAVFLRSSWDVEGRWPDDGQGVALGRSLARALGARLGDELMLEARTRPGAINALTFPVVGLVSSGNMGMDQGTVWMAAAAAGPFALAEGMYSAISLRSPGGRAEAEAMASRLELEGWQATTAREEVKDILAVNDLRRRAISIVVTVLLGISGLGIANTIIMAAWERVREVGTLRALGMSESEVRLLFIAEGMAMGAAAGLVGAALGSAVVHHYARVGIDFSEMMEKAGTDANISFNAVLYLQPSWPMVGLALAFGVVVSTLASLLPAAQAARLNPADAIRAQT